MNLSFSLGHLVNFILTATALLTAFVAEYIFHVIPCSLCIYMRWMFGGLILISFLGSLWKSQGKSLYIALIVGYLLTAIFSFYQLGVEQRWWAAPSVCQHESLFNAKTSEQVLNALSHPRPRCDRVNWEIKGISVSWLNFLFLLFTYILNVFYFRKIRF